MRSAGKARAILDLMALKSEAFYHRLALCSEGDHAYDAEGDDRWLADLLTMLRDEGESMTVLLREILESYGAILSLTRKSRASEEDYQRFLNCCEIGDDETQQG